jgi:hypothetical protein
MEKLFCKIDHRSFQKISLLLNLVRYLDTNYHITILHQPPLELLKLTANFTANWKIIGLPMFTI